MNLFIPLLNRHHKLLSTADKKKNIQVNLEHCMDKITKSAEICSTDLLLLFSIRTERKKQRIKLFVPFMITYRLG